MVMHARNPPRFTDGCSDRRDPQSYQTYKYPVKNHPVTDQRHEKRREASDSTPPNKMFRRSDSPECKPTDALALSKGKAVHTQRPREKDGGTSCSPQETTVSHSSLHRSNSHSHPSKASEMPHDPADDWSEHISSSGKKYYYNCRTEVSQWEKPKDWVDREQRQKEKEASKSTAMVNSFPKDRDYRREAFTSNKSAVGENPSGYPASSQSSSSSSGSSGAAQAMTSLGASTSSSSSSFSSVPSTSSSGSTIHASSSSASSSSTTSTPQPSSAALLQDPALLRQLLPTLQATLNRNHANMDVAKLHEVLTAAVTQASLQSMLHKLLTAGPSAFNITSLLSQAVQLSAQGGPTTTQSPMSVPADTSSPRSYVSPRVNTPHTNAVSLRPPLVYSSQPKAHVSLGKPGSAAEQSCPPAEKVPDLEDPRLHRQNSHGNTSPGPTHVASGSVASGGTGTLPSGSTVVSAGTPGRPQSGFTPSLATHFNGNLIKHVQGWPSEHVEKQVARLREESHNMGSLHVADICSELKNLRSLVRVCEIQATLREQRILFLRQQIKELDKMKTHNSYMI